MMKYISFLLLIVLQNCCVDSFHISKSVESRRSEIFLRCEIKELKWMGDKLQKTRVSGILYITNESNASKNINLKGISLKINDIICVLDDEWKQLLFEFDIGPKQVFRNNVYTVFPGVLSEDEIKIEIIWPSTNNKRRD